MLCCSLPKVSAVNTRILSTYFPCNLNFHHLFTLETLMKMFNDMQNIKKNSPEIFAAIALQIYSSASSWSLFF